MADERFAADLLDAAPDAMLVCDGDGRLVFVNRQTEALFGYSREELVGERVEVLVPTSERVAHSAHRARYQRDPRTRPMGAGDLSLAGRRKDGSEFPAEVSLSAIDLGAGRLVVAAVRDLTERLEMFSERERLTAEAERERQEARLHRSQRLESLGQLAGGVAHDFNNLLAVIVNYTSFVAEQVGELSLGLPVDTSTVLADVEQIQLAAGRATALTHQLLAFGRREVVRPAVLDLNQVVGELERLLRRTLGEHVQLSTRLEDDLWRVLVDQGQVEEVLVNLAVNARDAMADGGTLTIDSANQHVGADLAADLDLPAGDYVRLSVSDTGSGMPAEVRSRAFEPFFTTKPKGEGAGLGLATVHGMVAQAGGRVQICSEEGIGTVVTILLPRCTEQELPEPADNRTVAAAPGGSTVLVIEDDDALREVARRILTREGYTVLEASSGPAALELSAEHRGPIDLVVTDVVMPQMPGTEVADALRARRPAIRVLFMSGYAASAPATGRALTVDEAPLEKPFSAKCLLARVQGALAGAQDVSPGPGEDISQE